MNAFGNRIETDAPDQCLIGGGELGALMRSLDWSRTVLGPVPGWPQSLRTAVSICLNSRFAILLWWGPDLVMLYNDAYGQILGEKHPAALGQLGRECWHEIWDIVGPMLQHVFDTGEATRSDDLLLLLERKGYPEECYFTFSYSAVRDEGGGVAGVFTPVTETTEKVIRERRLRTLRDLAARSLEAHEVGEACQIAAETLAANPYDVPFTLIYSVDAATETVHLVGSAGLMLERLSSAVESGERPDCQGAWPLFSVARSGLGLEVNGLNLSDDARTPSGWPVLPRTALVLPVADPSRDSSSVVLVAGISPRKRLDEEYRSFLDLVAAQLSAAIANAGARQKEREQAESLAELDRAKMIFFSEISHEFRTPLTLMLGPIEDALDDVAAPLAPRQRERVELLQRSSLRLLRLVNALLDFSRLEAGRMETAFEPADLAQMTKELASVFQSAVERAGMQMLVDCPPLSESVYVDPEMWEKIVLNLLSNAFKFTLEGRIAVFLREAGDRVELSVRDTGTGITEDELPRLFERFHRVRDAKARTQEGSGIGLALVSELVQLHGGTVRVASTVGEGSTFTVSIPKGKDHIPAGALGRPRTAASTASGSAAYVEEALRWLPDSAISEHLQQDAGSSMPSAGVMQTEARRSRDTRILLVDDNADMRDYLERLLGELWTVESVSNGDFALTAALQRPPDLIVSDVMMPGLDGMGLLHALRSDPRTQDVPVILVSAQAQEAARLDALQAGADDYLVKPFSSRELVARVGARLELAGMRQQTSRRERALRLEAESALQVRDEFVSFVSHDLRSPLTTIKGMAQFLQRVLVQGSGESSRRIGDGLAAIDEATARMDALISELLDTARLQSGQPLALDPAPVDLVALLRSCIGELSARTEGDRFRLEMEPVPLIVPCDRARIERVIVNLLSNAIKYTPDEGAIAVSLWRERDDGGDWARLVVQDTGIGIPAADLPHVFDRFHRAQNVIGRFAGTGIGLAGAKQIVDQHNGTINVKSEEGVGSSFEVRLPLERRATLPPA